MNDTPDQPLQPPEQYDVKEQSYDDWRQTEIDCAYVRVTPLIIKHEFPLETRIKAALIAFREEDVCHPTEWADLLLECSEKLESMKLGIAGLSEKIEAATVKFGAQA